MFTGPIFWREAIIAPRRSKHYALRTIYPAALLILMCTAWLALVFAAAFLSACAVAQEKDRRTLDLLLMTRMSNAELVLGKLLASLLSVFTVLASGLPLFAATTLFGGVSFEQVGRVLAVTLTAALAAGSIGNSLAFWREKTFQTLAMTCLVLVLWTGLAEALLMVLGTAEFAGLPVQTWVTGISAWRAVLVASQPQYAIGNAAGVQGDGAALFVVFSLVASVLLSALAVALVRVWNPSRELRAGRTVATGDAWATGGGRPTGGPSQGEENAEAARAGHVDARVRRISARARPVWDNPILWREVCTWAYGRKILLIRAVYGVLFVLAALGLYWTLGQPATPRESSLLPPAAAPLAPFLLVSLVLVNALAVSSITAERDGQALDLLLVSDLSPREFVFGKLGGIFWVSKEMVLLPLALCVYLWWRGGLSLENLLYLVLGAVVMLGFVSMLGIHCGMNYASSRSAIGVSLGVVFFLFLGVVTCMLIMISFSGSFQTQLTPFLAFIVGGSAGLYATLGYRNPSPAIQVASLALPLATFYSITSFLLGKSLAVFLVTATTYGFALAAMMVPAVYEFDIAMGRTKTPGEGD